MIKNKKHLEKNIKTEYDYDGVHEALVIDANRKDAEAYARKHAKHTEPTYLTKNK